MIKKSSILSAILLCLVTLSSAQNLPSLISEKNINATFSILAYDEDAQEWGIAVATNNIYVGNSTIYIEPNVGAFSVIAETYPPYGINGLQKLKSGKSIKEAITEIRAQDDQSNYRQVSGIDAVGNAHAFTGNSLKYWNGTASEIIGKHYVVMGNQLAENVLETMATTFEKSKGSLAERLLESLVAGQNAGGQISGKQSAAVVVKGAKNEWYNQIDLRVDNAKQPIQELQTLMNYHYGRIRLNQSHYAFKAENRKRALDKLAEAEIMLDGWTGIYPKIAATHIVLGNEDKAIKWIKKGLEEHLDWTVYVPAFYVLKDHSEMKSIIKPESFTIKDWESAMGMLSNLGRELEVIELGKELIARNITSSYLYYLLGRGFFYEKDQLNAILYLKKAVHVDPENIEAEDLLSKIRGK